MTDHLETFSSAIDIRNGIYEMYISKFWFGDQSSGKFCDLSIISEWRKKWTAPLLDENHSKHSQTSGKHDTLSRNIATSDPSSCRQSFLVMKDSCTSSFSAITFDRDHLER